MTRAHVCAEQNATLATTRSALLIAAEKLKAHLATAFAARKELAQYKYSATKHESFCLVMADAADQAKLGCPLIKGGGRAGSRIKKIKQQFIGVLVYGKGYYIYRRLPVNNNSRGNRVARSSVTNSHYTAGDSKGCKPDLYYFARSLPKGVTE